MVASLCCVHKGGLRTSMLSFFMEIRKQEDSCGRGVPALNSVGDACVNHRSDR